MECRMSIEKTEAAIEAILFTMGESVEAEKIAVAGGIKVSEPALDLGIVIALVSSFKNKEVDSRTVIFGEVGLAGEVRAVSQAQQRVNEAVKLGFKTCILPGVCLKNIKKNDKIEIIGVNNVQEAIKLI